MTISDLHEARDEIATLKSRVKELESFVVAEGECHISDDEFQRMTAEIEQLSDRGDRAIKKNGEQFYEIERLKGEIAFLNGVAMGAKLTPGNRAAYEAVLTAIEKSYSKVFETTKDSRPCDTCRDKLFATDDGNEYFCPNCYRQLPLPEKESGQCDPESKRILKEIDEKHSNSMERLSKK